MLKYQRALQRIRNRKSALRKKPQSPSSSFNARPTRLFDERDDDNNDNEDEDDENEREQTEEAPVQFDELLFLDPREQRAVMRDQFSQAVKLAPNKLDVILVRLDGSDER